MIRINKLNPYIAISLISSIHYSLDLSSVLSTHNLTADFIVSAGNALSIYILCKHGLKSNSMNIALVSMAVADLLILVTLPFRKVCDFIKDSKADCLDLAWERLFSSILPAILATPIFSFSPKISFLRLSSSTPPPSFVLFFTPNLLNDSLKKCKIMIIFGLYSIFYNINKNNNIITEP